MTEREGARAPERAPGARLLALWHRFRDVPFGSALFGFVLGGTVPYSGTIGARVRALEPGHAVLEMRDRGRLRNHLGSIHAVALANLGELASGLAMTAALPAGTRGIVTGLSVEYRKKARGTLSAESRVTLPGGLGPAAGDLPCPVRAEIRDAAGDVVAVVAVDWRLRGADAK